MQWSEFFSFHERKLVNKVDEVLKACIQVRLCRQKHYVLEVSMVDVCIDSEQSLEDHFDYGLEVAREGHTECTREYFFIV